MLWLILVPRRRTSTNRSGKLSTDVNLFNCERYDTTIELFHFSYKLYRYMFYCLPAPLVDWLVVRFTALPSYPQAQLEMARFNRYKKKEG